MVKVKTKRQIVCVSCVGEWWYHQAYCCEARSFLLRRLTKIKKILETLLVFRIFLIFALHLPYQKHYIDCKGGVRAEIVAAQGFESFFSRCITLHFFKSIYTAIFFANTKYETRDIVYGISYFVFARKNALIRYILKSV